MPTRNTIALISPDFPPPFVGGSLVWLHSLVEHFPVGVDVLTYAPSEPFAEVLLPPHTVIRTRWIVDSRNPSRWSLAVGYVTMAWWFVVKNMFQRYEAVLVNPGVVGNSMLFLFGKLMGVTVIGIAHGEEITGPLHGKGPKALIKRTLMKTFYPMAAGFCCGNHFARQLLIDMGVSSAVIDVVPSCYNPRKIRARTAPRWPGHHIVSVGRLIERKGFHQLIEAAARILPKVPDLRVSIVGDGPMRPRLQALMESHQLQQVVQLKTTVGDQELAALYLEADLFVLANRMLANGDTEGCPVVLTEAMAAGLPLIAGRGGGAGTAIVPGDNGYLVDATNVEELVIRISEILLDPQLGLRMGEASVAKLARDHDPNKNSLALHETVQRIVRGERAVGYQLQRNTLYDH